MSAKTFENILYFETNLYGDIDFHLRVCKDDWRRREALPTPDLTEIVALKDKSLRTQLQMFETIIGTNLTSYGQVKLANSY